MKSTRIAIPVLVLSLALLACAGTVPDINSLENDGYEIREYEVFGMDCPGCHDGLENQVNKIAGVKSSVANWESKRLTVVIEKGATVSDDAIKSAVNKANFTSGERLR